MNNKKIRYVTPGHTGIVYGFCARAARAALTFGCWWVLTLAYFLEDVERRQGRSVAQEFRAAFDFLFSTNPLH